MAIEVRPLSVTLREPAHVGFGEQLAGLDAAMPGIGRDMARDGDILEIAPHPLKPCVEAVRQIWRATVSSALNRTGFSGGGSGQAGSCTRLSGVQQENGSKVAGGVSPQTERESQTGPSIGGWAQGEQKTTVEGHSLFWRTGRRGANSWLSCQARARDTRESWHDQKESCKTINSVRTIFGPA